MASSKPQKNGTYRIHLASNTSCYLTRDVNTDYVVLQDLDKSSAAQKWTITVDTHKDTFTATNQSNSADLTHTRGAAVERVYLTAHGNHSTAWKATEQPFTAASKVSAFNNSLLGDKVWDGQNRRGAVSFEYPNSNRDPVQLWVFEQATEKDTDKKKDYQSAFFTLTPKEAQQGPYDVIIVGSGIGGGVLAADIFQTNSMIGDAAQSVLLIEKGDVIFHSHCLNASRPGGADKDRAQQNDTFFAMFKDDYDVDTSGGGDEPPSTWKGGPMYCLGGRSAAWGLFAPRIHDNTLAEYFPSPIPHDLKETWYPAAESLLNLSQPETRLVHQRLFERLDMEADPANEEQWYWGRVASEFQDKKNFDFAEGAYSTIDKIMEIMMSKPIGDDGNPTEHKNFKVLVGTEVRRLDLSDSDALGVFVETSDGELQIPLRTDDQGNVTGRVVLAAGSVASPSILLRSDISLGDQGGHITDHDILYRSMFFRYKNPSDRLVVGAMKMQSYFALPGEPSRIGLANISLDTTSFLPRGTVSYKNLPGFVVAFIIPTPLEPTNSVVLVDDEPRVYIKRSQDLTSDQRAAYEARMESIAKNAVGVISDHLRIEFIDQAPQDPYFSYLELGGVAHELGTLPMPTPSASGCIDESLKVNDTNNVYVCDLSIFPVSPEVNPTLTLAAFALRLSRLLVPLDIVTPQDVDTVYVVNRSGEYVKVWLSNRAGVTNTLTDPQNLAPGGSQSWKRENGVEEAIFVYRLDKSYDNDDPSDLHFLDVPELQVGFPGEVVSIN